MKYLLLSLPLALMACIKPEPECVVYVNGKPVYNQCYQHDSEGSGSTFTPPTVNDDDRDPIDNGNNSNGGNSDEGDDDSNGGNSTDTSDDSNGDNSDDRSDDNGSDSSDR